MDLLVRGLAVYRVSRLLVEEDGPFRVLYNLRKKTGIQYTTYGEVFSYPDWNPLACMYCTSIWVGILMACLPRRLSVPFALSAIVVLIKGVTDKWL